MAAKELAFKQATRLIAIIDVSLQEIVLGEFMELGARGYNCVRCSGKGENEPMEDPLTGESLVRIEVVTNSETANSLMAYLHSPRFKKYAVTVFKHTVDVVATDRFADPTAGH